MEVLSGGLVSTISEQKDEEEIDSLQDLIINPELTEAETLSSEDGQCSQISRVVAPYKKI